MKAVALAVLLGILPGLAQEKYIEPCDGLKLGLDAGVVVVTIRRTASTCYQWWKTNTWFRPPPLPPLPFVPPDATWVPETNTPPAGTNSTLVAGDSVSWWLTDISQLPTMSYTRLEAKEDGGDWQPLGELYELECTNSLTLVCLVREGRLVQFSYGSFPVIRLGLDKSCFLRLRQ